MRERIRKLLLYAKETWLVLCVTVLYLLLLEGALSLAYGVADRVRALSPVSPDGRARSDVYAGVSWADEYLKELEECSVTRWTSYVYWRREPYQGRHINVNADGVRRTWTCPEDGSGTGEPLRIFTFGGSAMWGVGARDDFTIPSFLARKLQEKGIRCQVTNFGESGYVSTQEVIALLQQLRDGNLPDLVIFYDGVNDIYSAYQQQVAGLPQNEFRRAREFNVSQPKSYRSLQVLFVRRMASELSIVRFSRNLLRRFGVSVGSEDTIARREAGDNSPVSDALLREVLAVYKGNMQTVEVLGKAYGFKTLFYWQPTVFNKEPLTTGEQQVLQEIRDLQPFCGRMCELLQETGLAERDNGGFRDLSGIFAGVKHPVFIDWCHLSEWGNEQIADPMAADVMRLLGTGDGAGGPMPGQS